MATTSKNRSETQATRARRDSEKNPTTSAVAQSAPENSLSPSNGDVLRNLYTSLLRCRMAHEHVRRSSPLGDLETAMGHEAVLVGTTFDLRAEDTVAASGRDFGAQVSKGRSMERVPAQFDGRNGDAEKTFEATTFLADDPFDFGTGLALVHKLRKKQNVVVAFCPDDAAAINQWHDALKIAGAQKLPILYVIRKGAEEAPAKSRKNHLEGFSFMTRDYKFPGIVVDGYDVVAVWRVAQECIHRARNGAGPSLIECRTEFQQDPLAHMEHYLSKRSLWDESWRQRITEEIHAEINKREMAAV
jgi:TPP-dependent pyruvate/acetoin dehydrogenase alpha subunit